jgi:hypothetical protein
MSIMDECRTSTKAVCWPQELDEHGRNLREPWPEYIALLNDDIPEALATLKRLLYDDDRRLVPFLLSFPHTDEPIPAKQRDAYWLAGIPILFLKLVSVDRWYLMLRETCFETENLDTVTLDTLVRLNAGQSFQKDPNAYAVNLQWRWNHTLYMVAVFSENIHGMYCDCGALESYTAQHPALWMTLWRFRTTVMSRQFTKLLESQGLEPQVERVLYSYYCLYRYVE